MRPGNGDGITPSSPHRSRSGRRGDKLMNTFKTIARAALIAAALGSASAAAAEPVFAADKIAVSAPIQSRDGLNRRVRIHNNTGWTMLRFYASDSRITS